MNISSDQYHNGLGLFRQALNDPSLELEWIWKPVHQKSAIHRDEFQSIYQRLLLPKLGLIRQDCPETLDIRFDGTDLRCSIVGMPLIQHYCKQNTIDRLLKTSPQSVSFLRKRSKGSPLVLSNYYLRCNLKEEIDVEHDDAEVQTLLSNWSSTPKTFRLKKRYSFTDQNKLLRYDLTIVKHSPLTHNGSMKYSTNFEIEKKMPSYEVELEWTGDTRAFNLQEKIITETEKFTSSQMTTLSKAAFNYTMRYLGYVIQVSQDSCSIISKADKNDILREYQSLVSDKSQQHHHKHHHQSTVTSRDWIGPQPASLNMDHIRYYKDGWDGAISIRSGYAVTPKADGDRAMLYISESGNLYLIYRRMEVKTTGLRLESLHGTLLDGELVTTNREGQKIRLLLVFDL